MRTIADILSLHSRPMMLISRTPDSKLFSTGQFHHMLSNAFPVSEHHPELRDHLACVDDDDDDDDAQGLKFRNRSKKMPPFAAKLRTGLNQ